MRIQHAFRKSGQIGILAAALVLPTAMNADNNPHYTLSGKVWDGSLRATYVAGKGAAKFNWLKPNPTADAPIRTASRRGVHGGSYVCSPAGFGRKSFCRARPGSKD